MHYKLDRGVDHVLIDEAQDTSPRQWEIVFHIIEEFTAGAGARDGLVRTVFAVGDEKQSIFSFQGAAPREFDQRKRLLAKRFTDAGLVFDPVSFTYSFRSGAAILHSVDHVFRDEAIYKSIHSKETGYPIHNALSDAPPSLIELWPLSEPDDRKDIEGWRAPFDGVAVTSPEVKLARRVQTEIRRLIREGTMTGHDGARHPLSYGDILILVRRRGTAFDAVIQALKHASIPVAGADRLKLTEHIAIIDLMNLADALLLPQDDLALATALKSPLFGLDDDDLFKLAWKRRGSLRESLAAHASSDERLQRALSLIKQCERRAADETPFAFYAWLLGGDGGRKRMLARLGHEANDALDEFLELALSYERKAPASLQGFIAWLRAADTEVKRDMEISRDEVRVMTVHGAKGLEAAVVFMIDTTSSPSDTQRMRLVHVPHGPHGVTVWAGRKGDDPAIVADARQAKLDDTEDEYRRLLYVAMTRAADRLIIGGCMPGNRNAVRPLSWYDLIAKGLDASDLQMQAVQTEDGEVKRYAQAEDIAAPGQAQTGKAVDAVVVLPSWLRSGVAEEPNADLVLRPSDPAEPAGRRIKAGESPTARSQAMQRGTLVHRLLQSLPDIAATKRGDAALKYLARNAGDWPEPERTQLATQVVGLIAEPRFAAVFADGSRAEVSIVGRLTLPGQPAALVSGQIDRLVVTKTEVLIVDFKTNQHPPAGVAEVLPTYLRQLALYRAVLGQLYPDRTIRAALLWTEAPELMEISASTLDAQLLS